MPTADLTPYYQPAGTVADGTKFDNALAYLQSLLNGLDQNNWAAGKIFDPAKLMQSGGALGQGLVWDGSQWSPANVVQSKYRKTTAKQVVNSVAETDLLNGEVTIGAGALGTDKVLRLTAEGDWLNNSGSGQPFPRFKLKLGATTLVDTAVLGATNFSANVNRWGWRIVAVIRNLGAANSQWASLHVDGSSANSVGAAASNFAVGEGNYGAFLTAGGVGHVIAEGGAAGTVDSTVAQVLALTVINGVANASYDVTLKGALVEIA